LQPTEAQLQQLIDDGVSALYIENESGVFKAVAVGAALSVGTTMQCELKEPLDIGSCITFRSENAFTIAINDGVKRWNGTLEYSYDGKTWSTWDGTTTLSATGGFLAMRGTGNSHITYDDNDEASHLVISGSNVRCDGNIEALLDYATVSAGGHPQMDDACYFEMFKDCTALTFAPALPANTLTVGCYNGMFKGCISLLSAPTLPATTLTDYCYSEMFRGCAALRTIPALTAITLAQSCYIMMFYGCTSIKLSETQTGTYTIPYRIPTTGTGTDYTGSKISMFSGTGGTFTGSPSINTTYYLDASNSVV
jgi:hypothetical protein